MSHETWAGLGEDVVCHSLSNKSTDAIFGQLDIGRYICIGNLSMQRYRRKEIEMSKDRERHLIAGELLPLTLAFLLTQVLLFFFSFLGKHSSRTVTSWNFIHCSGPVARCSIDLAASIKAFRASCKSPYSELSGNFVGLSAAKLGKGRFRVANASSIIFAWVETCAAKSLSKPIINRRLTEAVR